MKFVKVLSARPHPKTFLKVQVSNTTVADAIHDGRNAFNFARIGVVGRGFTKLSRHLRREDLTLREEHFLEKVSEPTIVELYQREEFAVQDSHELVRFKDAVATDYGFATEFAPRPTGIRLHQVTDAINMAESTFPLRGLMYYTRQDGAALVEKYQVPVQLGADTHLMREGWDTEKSKIRFETVQLQEYALRNGEWATITGTDTIKFDDRGSTQFKLQQDGAVFSDQFYISGTRLIVQPDQIKLGESWFKNGRWLVPLTGETVQLNESTGVIHGLRLWQVKDSFTYGESYVSPVRIIKDDIEAAESAEQHGKRAFYVGDSAGLSETWLTDHPVAYEKVEYNEKGTQGFVMGLRREDVALEESGQIVGRPLYADRVALSESGRVADRLFSRQDVFTLNEVAFRRGKWTFRLGDSPRVNDSYPPFRFDWRDKPSLLEGCSIARVKVFNKTDTVQLGERGSTGTLGVEGMISDAFELVEQTENLALGQRDRAGLLEEAWVNGRRVYTARDTVIESDEAGPFYTPTPRRGESFTVRDEALQLHGKRQFLYTEEYELQENHLGRHGRVMLKERFIYQLAEWHSRPSVPGQTEIINLGEMTNMPSRADWVAVRENYAKEDTTQVVRVLDSGIMHTKGVTRRDDLIVADTGWANTSLDYQKIWRLKEARLLERPQFGSDSFEVREQGKLFRKSDYLEPNPDFYWERPGRLRSAVRLSRDAQGYVWAAWLEGETLWYAKRVKPDSWNGHQRYSVGLPMGAARSCTLYFDGLLPVPVVEYDGEIFEHRQEWVQREGVDPVTVGTKLAYLSADRRRLNLAGEWHDIGARSRIDQGFEIGGALIYDDLDQITYRLGTAPQRQEEPTEDVASVRWSVPKDWPEPPTYISPIEGNVMQT